MRLVVVADGDGYDVCELIGVRAPLVLGFRASGGPLWLFASGRLAGILVTLPGSLVERLGP